MSTVLPVLNIGPLTNTGLVCAFVAFTGIAIFNGLELLLSIFVTFRRQTSCYFFSLVVASIGVILYQVSVFLLIFSTNLNIYGVLSGIDIGWTAMISGQSMVLWSRLHLVCHSRWKMRAILYMIIINGVILHPLEIALTMLAVKDNVLDSFNTAFVNIEKATLVIFFVQELVISSVYVTETWKILRFGEIIRKRNGRRKIKQLLVANLFIIFMDVTLVCLEFLSLWGIWCSFKGLAYSIKLKIEFWILGQLKDSMKHPTQSSSHHCDCAYGRGKDATREIQLASMSKEEQKSRKSRIQNTFSSSIGRGSKSAAVDRDQIMKVTEVSVQSISDRKGEWGDVKGGKESAINHTRKGSGSGASSEVEFAAYGV